MAAELDPHLHAPARLQLAAVLSRVSDIEFARLAEILEVSDSVMSKHLAALSGEGYVTLRKAKADGRQRTWAAFTPKGRKAFTSHMAALEELMASARAAAD